MAEAEHYIERVRHALSLPHRQTVRQSVNEDLGTCCPHLLDSDHGPIHALQRPDKLVRLHPVRFPGRFWIYDHSCDAGLRSETCTEDDQRYRHGVDYILV